MKKNIILGFLLTIFMVAGMNAQDKDSNQDCKTDSCKVVVKFAPQKGDFTAQMLFGTGAYLNSPNLSVPGSGATYISGKGPYVNDISSNSNSVTNMIGAEFRYYTSDKFAIRVSGGAILRNTPYVINTPGVSISEFNDQFSEFFDSHFDGDSYLTYSSYYDYYDNYIVTSAWDYYSHRGDYDGYSEFIDYYNANVIPAYGQVDATEEAELHFEIGGEFLFKTKNERLFPYLGFSLPFDYARRSVFRPQSIDEFGNVTLHDTGARHVEITALSVQAVAGADYYIAKDLFFGFEVKPVNYTYAYSIKSPAPELNNLEAENSTVSFFAQFNFKLGFKF
jgi:hypothetical protein